MTDTTYDPTPATGYGDGVVKGLVTPVVRQDNNDWIYLGELRFNVHPYRSDLGGYPVRWIETLNDYGGPEKVWGAVQPSTAAAMLT